MINRKKDALFGKVAADVQYDVTKEGDDHPAFRYIL